MRLLARRALEQPKDFSTRRRKTLSLSLLKSISSFSRKLKQEKKQTLFVHENIETMSTNPDDYTIIKEGEAEILMETKNQVFYNKTQVPKSCLFVVFCIELVFFFNWVLCLSWVFMGGNYDGLLILVHDQ